MGRLRVLRLDGDQQLSVYDPQGDDLSGSGTASRPDANAVLPDGDPATEALTLKEDGTYTVAVFADRYASGATHVTLVPSGCCRCRRCSPAAQARSPARVAWIPTATEGHRLFLASSYGTYPRSADLQAVVRGPGLPRPARTDAGRGSPDTSLTPTKAGTFTITMIPRWFRTGSTDLALAPYIAKHL